MIHYIYAACHMNCQISLFAQQIENKIQVAKADFFCEIAYYFSFSGT
jgi:hypothetical protein